MIPNVKQPHLQDYLQIILRRRWIILTFFTVLVVTVLIGSLKMKPVYQATTTIMIERKSPRVISGVQEVTTMGTSDYYAYKDYYETQYKLLKSRTLLRKVINSAGLEKNYAKPGTSPMKKLSKAVNIKPIKNSQLVEITAEDTNPKMAARIANTIADEYIKQNLERSVVATSEAATWLSKRIEEQRQKLIEAETALQRYREENDIDVLPQMTMTEERAIEDIKAEYAKLHGLLANYNERYTDEHPKMVELKAQISSIKNKIQGLEDIDLGNSAMEYRVLEREVQTNKRMYESLLARMKEIDVSSTLNVNNISIVDRADIPKKPVKPNLKLNMILAVMMGLMMGTGLGFFVDYLDRTIKSPEDVKYILGSRFLGGIPDLEEKDERKRDKVVHIEPKSPAAEAYRDIRTEIIYSTPGDSGSKCILVTSAEPRAGKTMTAANLAIAFSQRGGKILVVDCDMRKPQLYKVFDTCKDLGLSEHLIGEADLGLIIKDTEIENLKVVTSGVIPSNPAEIISSEKMKKFISEVKKRFDFILIDSPPVVSVTDSVILADMVDETVQVVRSGSALIGIVQRAKEKLTNARSKVLGVVLNDIKTHQSDYYSNYYKYYHYYGEDTKGKSRRQAKQVPADAEEKV